jgi:hypothetical protein
MTPNINKILRNDPVSCRRGSPMGQATWHDSDSPLYIQRVRLTDDVYAPDGTYWGLPSNLWCAFNGDDDRFAAGHGTRIYVRAEYRDEAKRKVLALYPNVTFRR